MKNKVFLLFCLLVVLINCHSLKAIIFVENDRTSSDSLLEKDPFDLFEEFFKQGKYYNYYSAYLGEKFSENYLKPQEQSMFLQALATYFSFANDIHKSDSVWQLLRNGNVNNNPVKTNGSLNDLLNQTRNHQVAMFNEAHNAPKHRLLMASLLDSLYNQGFRYFAAEAFTNDSLFAATGYLTENNGFYIFEPNLSNLIRKAYKKGFKIIDYEDYSNHREQGQAYNIYNQTINIDKNAKTLVYCGYQHIDTARMAGWFQKMSGIDPLTVDQTYGYFYSLGKTATDSVFLIQPHSEDSYIQNADLFVFNDLDINQGNTTINIPDDIRNICKIVCVYEKNEFEKLTELGKIPIPVSVQNIEKESFVRIHVEKENYILLFLDEYGEILKRINI
jgi:hypothetical protein